MITKLCGKCGKEMILADTQANRLYCTECQKLSNYYQEREFEEKKVRKCKHFRGIEIMPGVMAEVMDGNALKDIGTGMKVLEQCASPKYAYGGHLHFIPMNRGNE